MPSIVVYVHGLWLGGGESVLLRRRLSQALAAETRIFRYSSVGAGILESAAALKQYLLAIEADTVHLVAHSMGGLVILEMFQQGTKYPPGRIVFTGSPVCGSRSARRLARLPFGRSILGRTATEILLEPRERRWAGDRDLGVIAGDLGIGLGRLLGRMDAPNDGTVLVDETRLPGATDRLQLRVSHTGMTFSPEVARQAAAFLKDGHFLRAV